MRLVDGRWIGERPGANGREACVSVIDGAAEFRAWRHDIAQVVNGAVGDAGYHGGSFKGIGIDRPANARRPIVAIKAAERATAPDNGLAEQNRRIDAGEWEEVRRSRAEFVERQKEARAIQRAEKAKQAAEKAIERAQRAAAVAEALSDRVTDDKTKSERPFRTATPRQRAMILAMAAEAGVEITEADLDRLDGGDLIAAVKAAKAAAAKDFVLALATLQKRLALAEERAATAEHQRDQALIEVDAQQETVNALANGVVPGLKEALVQAEERAATAEHQRDQALIEVNAQQEVASETIEHIKGEAAEQIAARDSTVRQQGQIIHGLEAVVSVAQAERDQAFTVAEREAARAQALAARPREKIVERVEVRVEVPESYRSHDGRTWPSAHNAAMFFESEYLSVLDSHGKLEQELWEAQQHVASPAPATPVPPPRWVDQTISTPVSQKAPVKPMIHRLYPADRTQGQTEESVRADLEAKLHQRSMSELLADRLATKAAIKNHIIAKQRIGAEACERAIRLMEKILIEDHGIPASEFAPAPRGRGGRSGGYER